MYLVTVLVTVIMITITIPLRTFESNNSGRETKKGGRLERSGIRPNRCQRGWGWVLDSFSDDGATRRIKQHTSQSKPIDGRRNYGTNTIVFHSIARHNTKFPLPFFWTNTPGLVVRAGGNTS